METQLTLLIIEDSESDAALTIRALTKAGYEVASERIETAEQLSAALNRKEWDAIIADHNLPQFDAVKALQIVKETKIDIPFIVVSGTIGEETAVSLMKAGAHDYVMKSNLVRLAPAIEREIIEAKTRHERQSMELAFYESETRFRKIFEESQIGIALSTPDWRFTSVNDAFCRMLGYEENEIKGQTFAEITYPDTIEQDKAQLARLRTKEIAVYKTEKRYIKKNRDIIYASTTVSAVYDEKGELLYHIAMVDDVTERKLSEEKYQRSARQWRATFDSINDMVCLLDTDSKILRLNKAMKEMIGEPYKEIIGRHCWEKVHGTSCPVDGCPMVQMKESHRRETISCPAKGRIWEATVDPFFDESGTFAGAVHVMVDITERKKDEDARREWQEKYYTLIEKATEGIVVSQDGVRKFVNTKLLEMYGYSKEELVGKAFTAITHPDDQEITKQRHLKRLKGETTGPNDARILTKAGTYHWFRFSGISIMWEGRPASLVFVTDVNDEKLAQEKLAASEVKYRSLFEDSRDSVNITTVDGRFLDVNQAMLDLYGYTKEEMLALSATDTYVNSDDRRRLKEEMVKKGSIKDFETKLKKKDGTVMDCVITASIWRDEKGEIAGYRGIIRDITPQKKLENDLKEALVKVGKTAEGIINVVSNMSELKDPYTAGHQRRVAQLARAIAEEMALPEEMIEGIRIAGTVHDIGKLAVPAEILSKPGRLSEMEFSLLKGHPQAGYDILKNIDFPWQIADVVLQHHLRLDGSGYPEMLKGKEIMLEARILAVADVVEAMSSHRPYRPSLGVDKALDEISRNSDKLYDPDAVNACLTLFRNKGFKFE